MEIRTGAQNPFDSLGALTQSQGAQSSSAPSAAGGQAGLTNTAQTLGQQDFLRLLVTQLQAQDPLNPQEPTEFTAQLAQFSSLEQLINVNTSIQQLAQFQAAVANTAVASFIGNEITAHGNKITLNAGQAGGADFRLAANADDVKVTIRSSAGAVVRVLSLGPASEGVHAVEWDGLNSGGVAAPDGTYTFEVEATSGGERVDAETLMRGLVTGIDFDATGTFLIMGSTRIPLGDLIGVRQPAGVSA